MSRAEKYIKYIADKIHPRRLSAPCIFDDMSPMEYALVCSFSKHEQKNGGSHMTVGGIAEDINASVPQVSRMLKSLEERGLIKRLTDENCRRNTFVVVSDNGKALYEKNTEKLMSFADKVLESFTDEELDYMMQLQKKLFNAIEQEFNNIKSKQREE